MFDVTSDHCDDLNINFYITRPGMGGATQQSNDYFDNQAQGLVPYLEFASRISLLIESHAVCNHQTLVLADMLKKALVSGKLTSLKLKDLSVAREAGQVIMHLMPSFRHSTVNLQELDVNINEAWQFSWHPCASELKACRSLKRVEISVNGQSDHVGRELIWFVSSLPDSVERLVVLTYLGEASVLTMFKDVLRSHVLPNLVQLTLVQRHLNEDYPTPMCMSSLIDTIAQTKLYGRARPIQFWHFNDVCDNPLLSVVYLRISGFTVSACNKLIGAGHAVYPDLKQLCLETYDVINPLPFLQAIPSRMLEKFSFFVEKRARSIVWDMSNMKIIASMSSLRVLSLHSTYFSLLPSKSKLSDVVLPNTWPCVHYLDISWPELSADHLRTLLAAAPAAKQICLNSKSITCSTMLAMILHYCTDVVSINIQESSSLDTLRSTGQAFVDYPTARGGLQRLSYLSIRDFPSRSHQAFHHLLRHFHRAPLLEFVDLNPADASTINLYLTRCLPRLRSLFQLSGGAKDRQEGKWATVIANLRSSQRSQLTDCLMFRHVPCSYVAFEREHRSIDKDLCESYFTFDEIVTEKYGSHTLYPCFRSSMQHDSSISGREAFYDRLYDLLSDEDKMLTML